MYYTTNYDFPDGCDRATVYSSLDIRPVRIQSVNWEENPTLRFSASLPTDPLALGSNVEFGVTVKIDEEYAPTTAQTLVGLFTVTAASDDGGQTLSQTGTLNIVFKTSDSQEEKPEDSDEVNSRAKDAGKKLQNAKNPFALNRSLMYSLFGLEGGTATAFEREMFAVLVMSEIPEETF